MEGRPFVRQPADGIREWGIMVAAVVITRFEGQPAAGTARNPRKHLRRTEDPTPPPVLDLSHPPHLQLLSEFQFVSGLRAS
jgi:hypothetical protein